MVHLHQFSHVLDNYSGFYGLKWFLRRNITFRFLATFSHFRHIFQFSMVQSLNQFFGCLWRRPRPEKWARELRSASAISQLLYSDNSYGAISAGVLSAFRRYAIFRLRHKFFFKLKSPSCWSTYQYPTSICGGVLYGVECATLESRELSRDTCLIVIARVDRDMHLIISHECRTIIWNDYKVVLNVRTYLNMSDDIIAHRR